MVVSKASFRSLSGVSQKFISQIKSLSQFFEANAQALKTGSLFSLVYLVKKFKFDDHESNFLCAILDPYKTQKHVETNRFTEGNSNP